MPLALRGITHGISLLFPMERLFERYVEVNLRQQLPIQYSLKSQARSESLCKHQLKNKFLLQPDLLIQVVHKNYLVLDTKWKLIVESDVINNYGLSQSDFYQMFAYGHKYLDAKGDLILIYPRTKKFSNVLPPFHFSPDLRLWVVPFDLENDVLYWPVTLTT